MLSCNAIFKGQRNKYSYQKAVDKIKELRALRKVGKGAFQDK